jgi:hypothetical protein
MKHDDRGEKRPSWHTMINRTVPSEIAPRILVTMDAQGPNTFVPKKAQLFAVEEDTDELARPVAECGKPAMGSDPGLTPV